MQSTPRLHGKSNLYLPDNLSTSPNLRVDSRWYLFLSLGRIDREVMDEGTSHTIYPSRGRPQDHKGCVRQCVLVHVDLATGPASQMANSGDIQEIFRFQYLQELHLFRRQSMHNL